MTTRARLTVALMVICGSLMATMVGESATAAPRPQIKLTVSTTSPEAGEPVRLRGTVKPAMPGKRVKVQGKAAGTGWVTIARPRLSKKSTYRTSITFPRPGGVKLRVATPRVSDSGRDVSRVWTLRVGPSQSSSPVITTSSLPNPVLGRAYSARIRVAGDRAGQFAIDGSLPAGLALDAATGVISGTPTKVEKKEFTVTFRDTAGRTATKALSLTVDETYLITSITLPSWTVSHSHSTTLKAKVEGTWSIPVHLLPRGFAFDPATATISGVGHETRTTTFPVTFDATNGLTETRNLSITVLADGVPVISTTSVPGITVNAPYSAKLSTVGNRNGTWTVVGGTLPAGLSLSGGGTISGVPTMPNWSPNGAPSFTVGFTQSGPAHVPGSDTQVLTIQVDPDTVPQVATTSMSNGTVGYGYLVTLGTVGNRQGEWAITGGSLPPGLVLNAASGKISGTPTAVGSSTFTVTFTALNTQTDSATFTITVVAAP